jgi:ankyrin repeat protein
MDVYNTLTVQQKVQLKYKYVHAAKYGNIDILIECINQGIPISAYNDYGWNALHIASRCGQIDIVQYLIKECHIDITEKESKYRMTAFLVAATYERLEIVQYFIEECKNCDFELQVNSDEMNALDIACRYGSYEIVKYLISECHWNIDMKRNYRRTALHYACERGHIDIVHYVIHESNCDISSDMIQDLLRIAISYNNPGPGLEMIQYLMDDCQADITATFKDDRNVFDLALNSRYHHTDIVVFLLTNLRYRKK